MQCFVGFSGTLIDSYHHSISVLNVIFNQNVFDSFIPIIMLSTFKSTSSILLRTHILQNEFSTALQLTLHLSRLTMKRV